MNDRRLDTPRRSQSMIRPVRLIPLLAVPIALLLGAGCGSNPTSPTPVTQGVADDVATQMASGVGSDNGGVTLELKMFGAAFPTGPRPTRPQFRATRSDTVITAGSITYAVSYTFYDADGVALDGWGPT